MTIIYINIKGRFDRKSTGLFGWMAYHGATFSRGMRVDISPVISSPESKYAVPRWPYVFF